MGSSTRHLQLTGTPEAGFPLGSHAKILISTSVLLFMSECNTVRKKGLEEKGVATTLIGCS